MIDGKKKGLNSRLSVHTNTLYIAHPKVFFCWSFRNPDQRDRFLLEKNLH